MPPRLITAGRIRENYSGSFKGLVHSLVVFSIKSFCFFVALCYVLMSPVAAQAQDAPELGILTGRVIDTEIGESLPLANVLIPDLGIGGAANLDGVYRIERVPPGIYSITVSYTGFGTKTITGIEIQSGQITTLDVTLDPAAEVMEEVVVTAERERGSTADVLNERKVAAAVIDVLDTQQLAAAGGSAAAAIERASGAEVTDGKYVQVRGFGGRYGKVTINGVPVPSISPDEKSVPLDVVSSDVLQSASVAKGWTPDLPADFVGGLVDLRTIETPNERMLSFKAKTSYNSATSFTKGLTIGGCNDTWTGFSGCYRWPTRVDGLPDSVGVTGEVVYSGPRESAHFQQIITSEEDLNQVAADIARMMPIGPSEKTLPLGQSYELSAGNRFTVNGRPFGAMTVFSYSNGFQQFEDYEFNSPGLDPIFGDVRQTEHNVRAGVLAGLSYELSEAHQLSSTVLYNRLTEDLSRYQAGLFDPSDEQQTARTITNQRVTSALFSGQLAGEHNLFGRATAEWTAAYSFTSRLEPGTMPVQYQGPQGLVEDQTIDITAFNLPDSLILSSAISRKGSLPSRNHFDQQDNAYLGKLDLSFPFRISDNRYTIKTGVYADLGERVQEGHRVIFLPVGNFGDLLPDIVFAPENMAGDFVPLESFPTEPGVYIDEATQEADNFEANLDILATYAMLDAEPIKGIRIVGGVRFTESRQSVQLIPKYNGIAIPEEELPFGQSYFIERTFSDWLPALSLQITLSEKMDLRGGYGRTIGRPQFRELVPFIYQPRPGAPAIAGNPDLERTLVDNIDVRWSWYPIPTALFSIGGFYKHFDGPVEPLSGTGGRYINTGEANTYGVEGEIRIPFGLLSQKLASWAIRMNVAVLETEAGSYFFVELPDDPSIPPRSILIPKGNRPLFGQTPLLVNVGLTYENEQSSATVLFRYTGEQLRYLRSGGFRTYREPLTTLDIILSQKLWNGFTLGLEARNLLGNEISFLTELPLIGNAVENNVVQVVTSTGPTSTQEFYNRGRTLELSLSWSF